MKKSLRIVLAQLDLMVGDIQGNITKLIDAAKSARDVMKADLIVFSELSITGYPPEDLLFRPAFIDAAYAGLQEFIEQVKGIYCLIGHPHLTPDGLYNTCSLIYEGSVIGQYAKQHLPNTGVFDELRYFTPGHSSCVIPIHDIPVGIMICEDLWHPSSIQQAANKGARLIISPNASPFEIHKHQLRQQTFSHIAKEIQLPIVYVNCVGGQDELVFDGGSMVISSDGTICQQAGFF